MVLRSHKVKSQIDFRSKSSKLIVALKFPTASSTDGFVLQGIFDISCRVATKQGLKCFIHSWFFFLKSERLKLRKPLTKLKMIRF